MSNEDMTYQNLLRIIELIKSASHFGEVRLKMGEVEVELKRGPGGVSVTPPPVTLQPPAALPKSEDGVPHDHAGERARSAAPAATSPERAASSSVIVPSSYPPGAVLIKSPMVGTFYRAPEPGAAPFCKVGQLVAASDTVCLIEVMKLMNSISAGQQGVVTDILVEDGEPVEFGQLLMVIDPEQ